jgi:hypothetical protein
MTTSLHGVSLRRHTSRSSYFAVVANGEPLNRFPASYD